MLSTRFRPVISFALIFAMLCFLIPCAFAEEAEAASGESSEVTAEEPDSTLLWPSAEAAVLDLIQEYEVDETHIALGYYNTVTGEEYYLNPDQYMDAASLYKVPLNMYYAEKVANGELDPDGYIGEIPYRTLMEETLINSSNEMAHVLIAQFNDYVVYRQAIAPYMGEDTENPDDNLNFYAHNYFTPRQMVTCLKLLYSEPDRFPSVIETMQRAEPDNYFCLNEHRYTIAHKYGWNEDDETCVLHINDCGIVYTEDPIVIVLFTYGINRQLDFLSAFCTRCIDYTESATAVRKAAEEAEQQAKAAAEEAERQAQEAAQAEAERLQKEAEAQASAALQTPEPQPAETDTGSAARLTVIAAALGFVCIASVILILVRTGKRKSR